MTADPASFIVGAIIGVLCVVVILVDLMLASNEKNDTARCPRGGSRHHTDCYDPDNKP